MNPIQYSLTRVRHQIPPHILQLAFQSRAVTHPGNRWMSPTPFQSEDAAIEDKIIHGRVNIDINLMGGTQVGIPLSGVRFDNPDMTTRIFHVPMEMTNERRIVSVQSLNYMNNLYMGGPGSNGGGGGDLMRATMDLYNAIRSMPIVATANCQLVGENTVLVRDNVNIWSNSLGLTCLVENDAYLNNLNPGIYDLYAQMVVLATKSYIYNNSVIELDRGQLVGGRELGRVREIIDQYADADLEYQELFRTRWQKASFTNDRPRMYNHIRSMMGRGK